MAKIKSLSPAFWGSLILVFAQIFAFFIAFQEKIFIEAHEIIAPEVSLGIPLLYFFSAVIVLGIVLFFVPVFVLKVVLRVLFAVLFAWGLMIILGLMLPFFVALAIAIAVSLLWLFIPKLWLHNLLLALALVSVGSVFGFILSPWVAIGFMLILSVYDIVAVRFGYMMWMAKKLSESDTLPAFVIPRKPSSWNINLKKAGFRKLFEASPDEREFSILGGGDIGFPLLLTVSVFFAYGFSGYLIVALFSVLGLISAYLIQQFFLKGKPMPALPPISLASLVGFLIVYFFV